MLQVPGGVQGLQMIERAELRSAEDFQQQVGAGRCEKQGECWKRVGAAVYKQLDPCIGGPEMGN